MSELEQMRAELKRLQSLIAQNEQLRAQMQTPVDMSIIKPGMSDADAKLVAGAIVRALREAQQ